MSPSGGREGKRARVCSPRKRGEPDETAAAQQIGVLHKRHITPTAAPERCPHHRDFRPNVHHLSVNLNRLGTSDHRSPARPFRLKTGEEDRILRIRSESAKMMKNPPPGRHSASGDDDHGVTPLIQHF